MADVFWLLGAAALTLIGAARLSMHLYNMLTSRGWELPGAAHLTFHGIKKSSTEEKGES